MDLRFEWDAAKERRNIAKHGVDFRIAARVFDGPRLVMAEDEAHSRNERRLFAFGFVGGGVLTVRFTVRDERVRIIGAGYWRRGREAYEEANRLYG